jgi:hypothetical protein
VTATNLNLTIEQGATFSQTIAVGSGYNGHTARGTLRRSFGGDILAELTCSAISAGNVTVSLTAAQTRDLTAIGALPSEREVVIGAWDLEADNAGAVARLRQGKVILSREATT